MLHGTGKLYFLVKMLEDITRTNLKKVNCMDRNK